MMLGMTGPTERMDGDFQYQGVFKRIDNERVGVLEVKMEG